MAEEVDVEAIAVAKAVPFADIDQDIVAASNRFVGRAFGHEEDFRRGDGPVEIAQERLDFVDVGSRGDNEFELVWVLIDPLPDDAGLEA